MATPQDDVINAKNDVRHSLYRATITGEWKILERLLDDNPEAISTRITPNSGTVVHLAIATNKKKSLLRNLFARTSLDVLRMTTEEGDTALHHAASFGNLEAVKLLVSNDPQLPNIPNHNSLLPLHEAAKSAQREVFTYLFGLTKGDVDPSPFEGDRGTMLVENLVTHGLCDLALELVKKYTHLATRPESLHSIACHQSNFFSNTRNFDIVQHVIFTCLIILRRMSRKNHVENGDPKIFLVICLTIIFPPTLIFILGEFVFSTLRIKKMKAEIKAYDDSVELARFICNELRKIDPNEAKVTFQNAAKAAARNGSHEIVKEIMMACPAAVILEKNDPSIGIFHIAVKCRQHKVFNLLFQMSSQRDALLAQKDKHGNTILHIAATFPPSNRPSQVYGPAFEMQHEMLWYKIVEKFMPPCVKNIPNNHGMKPRTIFTKDHKDLVKEGETWMRNSANSGTIVAALITTIAFAAAITIPGGIDSETGFPVFSDNPYFWWFTAFNTGSLFCSIISLLIFLKLQTSSYAEEDFMQSLPACLYIAASTLFISIYSIIGTSFGAISLICDQLESTWVLIILLGFGYFTMLHLIIAQLPFILNACSSAMGNTIAVLQFRPTGFDANDGIFPGCSPVANFGIFRRQGNDLIL